MGVTWLSRGVVLSPFYNPTPPLKNNLRNPSVMKTYPALVNYVTRPCYKKKVYKTMRLKRPKSLHSHKAEFPKFSVFIGQRSMLRHYYIQNVKNESQIRVYKVNKEIATHSSQFTSVKVMKFKKISRSISGKVKEIEALEK